MRPKRFFSQAFVYLLLILGAFVMFLPVFWLLRSSLMTLGDIFKYPPILWPAKLRWKNYADAMNVVPFVQYFFNTMIVMVPNVLGTVITASLSAYGLSRFKFRSRNFWFSLVVAAIVLPPTVVLIPQFLIWSRLGLIDTFWPLIVPSWFGGGAFNVFLLRQFFLTIPREYDDAAQIDGASYWKIFWRIMFPLIQPALIVVGLFTFLFVWNDFFGPLIYLSSQAKYTLAIGLRFFVGSYATQWNSLMAASCLVILPPVLLFLVGQRFFVEGVTMTGVKG
ncbi:MAG TPA: carbohydrate ABC transporter permease [Rectinemataceae bacterium]|nr:carbohydrate ABC transporter permease [Rectinemataceae bacterium]